MQVIINLIKENKRKLIIILIVLVLVIGLFVIFNKKNDNKVYRTESYVFVRESYEHDNGLVSELPYINIKGDDFREVNTKLIKKYYEAITVDDRIMTYSLYHNDNIISLIVKIYEKESPDSYPLEVYIYNIDSEIGILINDNQILQLFGVSSADVEKEIMNELDKYYKYELRKKYIEDNCDFDCYLSKTNSLPLVDCSYYVKDNVLYAYKTINLGSNFFYDNNSGFNLFNFKIADK